MTGRSGPAHQSLIFPRRQRDYQAVRFDIFQLIYVVFPALFILLLDKGLPVVKEGAHEIESVSLHLDNLRYHCRTVPDLPESCQS
jgi:hypothetical protein